ncbi:unnamed protein product, partial [marine sediment metagenome]
NQLRDDVTITTSAKILGDDYKRGICQETIEQYHKRLNGVGIIKVSMDKLLKDSTTR